MSIINLVFLAFGLHHLIDVSLALPSDNRPYTLTHILHTHPTPMNLYSHTRSSGLIYNNNQTTRQPTTTRGSTWRCGRMIEAPTSNMPTPPGPPDPTPPSPSSSSERRFPASKKRAYYMIGAAALVLFLGLLIGLLATRGRDSSGGHHASQEAAAAAATTDTPQVLLGAQ
jgi:hypothetical protein